MFPKNEIQYLLLTLITVIYNLCPSRDSWQNVCVFTNDLFRTFPGHFIFQNIKNLV